MDKPRFHFTLYVSQSSEAAGEMVAQLRKGLEDALAEQEWELEVVDVLATPEKATQANVFATPTLARDLPEPVRLALVELSRLDEVVTVITSPRGEQPGVVL